MPYYRIWEYPDSVVPYKHCYIKRERLERSGEDMASKNVAAILSELKKLDREEQQKNDADYEKLDVNLSRSRRCITDLILCNKFDYFCTFTFNAQKIDRFNYDACQKKLRKFFNNFKSRYAPDFKYLIIPEFHKNGAIHFHGVCSGFPDGELTTPSTVFSRINGNLVKVPNTKGYKDWPRYHKAFGFFNCSEIQNYNACAFYVTKYITKDLFSVGKGRAVYMCSKGLERPKLVYDADDVPLIFKVDYENEFCAVSYERADFSGFVQLDYTADDLAVFDTVVTTAQVSEQTENYIESAGQISLAGYNSFADDWWDKLHASC